MDRRRFIAAGIILTPIAAALSACGKKGGWPEGMAEIKWDRDTCTRCSMVISDRRFAAEMRGGPQDTVLKFDDIGCAIAWLRDKAATHAWLNDAATRFWVADSTSHGNETRWLEARTAHYLGKTSPMGYNFGAVAQPQPGTLDFTAMREHVLAKEGR